MDIDEFERTTQPKAKRSKLEPFHAQIFELKRKGYANWQIRDWLAANNVKVSQEAVRKFIKSRDDTTPPTVPTSEKVSTNVGSSESKVSEPEADLSGLTDKQRRELVADKYTSQSPKNSLAQRLLNKGKENQDN
jgi:hypothetical protein